MINKQTAALLFGYGYQLQDKEGSVYDIGALSECPYNENEIRLEINGELQNKIILNNQIGTDYFVRCRPLSSLTNPMENGEVPMENLFIMYGGGAPIESKKYWQDDFEENIRYSGFESLSFQLTSVLMAWHFKPSALTDEMCVWI